MPMRVILIIAVLLAATLVAALVVSQQESGPLHVSGFIEADEIRVGSLVGGRVQSVAVKEGQVVRRGDLLVELEPYDLLQRQAEAEALVAQRRAASDKLIAGFRSREISQAKARVDHAKARLDELRHGPRPAEIQAAEAELRSAQADLDVAQRDQGRISELVSRGADTTQHLDEADRRLKSARERLRVREENLGLLREGTRSEEIAAAQAQYEEARQAWMLLLEGARREDIAQAEAAVRNAEATLAAIDRRIQELKIQAPVDGTVEALELQPGDLVGAGQPVLSILDSSRLWVRTFVPEDRLDVSLGQDVRVGVDSYPGESFQGRVTFISRQAEFVPGNIQTPEDRSKQVFRIKVEIVQGRERLRAGMAADVWLEGGGAP